MIDVEVEAPIIWPPDVKSWIIWKDPNAGKDWGQEEKGLDGITDSMDMGLVGLRELAQSRDWTYVSYIGRWIVNH